jgi:polysaccharide export outer membrane protein
MSQVSTKQRQNRIQSLNCTASRHAVLGTCAIILTLSAMAMTGCKSFDYRASELPHHMHAASVCRSSDLDLARMAGPGQGTSQIAPGDLVEFTIISGRSEEASEPIQARVSQAGQISLPLIGEIPVAGLEPVEAEQRIAAAAVDRNVYRQPVVMLQVTERAVNRVTVLGAVAVPGVHSLPRGSSDLANAIAVAGGLTKEAGTKVDILRHDSSSFYADKEINSWDGPVQGDVQRASYNVTANSQTPTLEADAQLQARAEGAPESIRLDLAQAEPDRKATYQLNDRDVVMVLPEEKRLIHVTGLVNHANQFELPRNQDMTVLDAIALAGGISSPVADKIYVIRRVTDRPEPAVIQVSLRKAKTNGAENLRLAPGDLISVEATPATMFVDTANNFFRMTLGLGSNVAVF